MARMRDPQIHNLVLLMLAPCSHVRQLPAREAGSSRPAAARHGPRGHGLRPLDAPTLLWRSLPCLMAGDCPAASALPWRRRRPGRGSPPTHALDKGSVGRSRTANRRFAKVRFRPFRACGGAPRRSGQAPSSPAVALDAGSRRRADQARVSGARSGWSGGRGIGKLTMLFPAI